MAQANLHIDLDAVVSNWRALDAQSGAATRTAAVVKADSYGLGAGRVAPALYQAGARDFFVALAEEGARLRPHLGEDARIFILGGHMAGDAGFLRDARLIPMLNSAEQAQRHLQAIPESPVGVQLDTGMNRLGMEAAEWQATAPQLMERGIELVMSHLACSDEPEHEMNAKQLAEFKRMTDGMGLNRSLAATGGILLGPDYHFDVTRPGIGLYGGRPFEEARHVATLSLPVIQTRVVQPGETVGYGNTWTAERETKIATLSAGYADGIHRVLSNITALYAGDTACPLRGRVSMDLLTVDVTDLDTVPDTLDLLGPHQGVDTLADLAGTIGYEILTSLGPRYARNYAEPTG
ncbi:alanine racemase [Thioclava electrotropha]|uniref:Alanine racemase n=1 Tax=Thioclava electrotropha TaxID=1549850 RepID=A0ABX6YUM9_9RHOB|nr:alanine racemase [Thioclava electrotropha]QPZ91398.1 alanine racemase [Thioclava electrotropha]